MSNRVHRRTGRFVALSALAMLGAVMLPTAVATGAAAAAPQAAPAVRAHVSAAQIAPTDDDGGGDGHYCDGCEPPLQYLGGRVMDTLGATGVTVTPVYWVPANAPSQFPDGYEQEINTFLANVAAASGSTDNVFSVPTEYYQVNSDSSKTGIQYKITAGTPIVDTNPFPANGCTPVQGMTNCITDSQIRAELTTLAGSNSMIADLTNFYPMFFLPGVETADSDGSNSAAQYCGYHRAFPLGSSLLAYANMPYEEQYCDAGQGPNGNHVTEGAVSTLSHELNEAITDPVDDARAWNDNVGYEIADICENDYGVALGSTDPANPATTQYNQVINGAKYYIQTEFSNLAFAAHGPGNGCVQSEDEANAPVSTTSTAVARVYTDAYPNSLPADGKTTADVATSISDASDNVMEGDTVFFSVYAIEGNGQCGTLSATSAKTGADGYADVTYTASLDDVVCGVVATDVMGGQSSTGAIYQGAEQADAPMATDTFPTTMQAGAAPITFTTTFTNPTALPIPSAQVDFSIFPGDKATVNVDAGQVQLGYSLTGAAGPFNAVTLSGSSINDGDIQGTLGDMGGLKIPPDSQLVVTYQMSLDASVPDGGADPLLSFEAYLDQANTATGSSSNLADTEATDVVVTGGGAAAPVTTVPATPVDTTPGATTTTIGAVTPPTETVATDTEPTDTEETDDTSDSSDTVVHHTTASSDDSGSRFSGGRIAALIFILAALIVAVLLLIRELRKRK
ncbi:MAG TPA: Ig-like domain-containing protein [Ilumatobacteraceae bacterium]